MKRRDVVKLGAVAAGAGLGVPGCSVPKLIGQLHGTDGAAAFNAMLDEQLGKLEKPGLLHRMVESRTKKQLTEAQRERIAEKDALFRRMLGTVMITQAFRELPEETRSEAAVQERMFRHWDQIGSTVFEISDMLAALEPKERAQVKSQLEKHPDMPMELGEMLDARSQQAGLSTTRRLQLRKMMSQTAFRLKNGHASSLIDEYVAKVDKLRTTDERNAAAIELATKLGERGFWRRQQQLAADPPGATPTTPAQAPPAPPPPSPPPAPPVGTAPAQPQVPQAPPAQPPGTQAPGTTPPVQPGQEPMPVLLHKSARTAARRGDCRAIGILGKRIHELDATYYETSFRTDPMIVNCRPGVPVDERGAPLPATAPPPPPETVEAARKGEHPGQQGLRVGGYMFGIGLGIGLLSIVLVSTSSDIALLGLFGLTAAVILVGLGLIILLISSIIYATSDD